MVLWNDLFLFKSSPEFISPMYKRRKLLINPGFQLRFLGYLAGALFVGLSALYFCNYYYYEKLVAEGAGLGLTPDHPYFAFIDDQKALLNKVYLVASLVLFATLVVFGLFLSHRIAGPIHHMERILRLVTRAEGDGALVHLRKGDFFPEFAEVINDAIRYYNGEIHRQVQNTERVKTLAGKQVLIVEDNELNRDLIVSLLESYSIRTCAAENGRLALELLENDPSFDAVLMDGQMPIMDGYEATQRIRQLGGYVDTPIIAMSANTRAKDRQRAIDAGMNTIINKPISAAELFDVLASQLDLNKEPIEQPFEEGEASRALLVPEISGIDVKVGLSRTQYNKRLYLSLLRRFVESYSGFETQFQAAASVEDDRAQERLAHTLKGVAGNLGADKIETLAGQLEYACASDSSEKHYLAQQLGEVLNETLARIGTILKAVDQGTISREMTDREFAELIREARRLIQACDTQATELVYQLIFYPKASQNELAAIIAAVHDYNFERAEVLLNRYVDKNPAFNES